MVTRHLHAAGEAGWEPRRRTRSCPTEQHSCNQTSAGSKAGGSQDWLPHFS